MKRKPSFGRLLILASFIALAPAALASTWYVDGVNGNNENNCQTRKTACKTIGHAISLASSGDSIMVAPAIYKETLTINFSLKLIGADAATTIVDGGGSDGGTVISVSSSAGSVVLSKMTLRNGGAGIVNSGALRVDDSTISGNSPGGGVENDGAITLDRSTVRGNSASGIDGYYSNAGGIYNEGTLTVNDSTISDNSAVGNYVCGGGIYNAGTLTINNSTINGNQASGESNSSGGGIDNEGAVVLNNSTLTGNSATIYGGDGYGGGISYGGCVEASSYAYATTLRNSIVADNKAGNCYGTMTSKGYNLSSDDTCHFKSTGDLNNTHPKLGPWRTTADRRRPGLSSWEARRLTPATRAAVPTARVIF
ncbi:MAG TPA: right-handed parallel beta-helix repeat-containing protein [Terriglobales bacterium]|nr:right-handed parallel beta-helix repeat-containing protein [Terriglobales bacterium]